MTDKNDPIYRALVRYIDAHGYAPTVRELAKMIGIKSTSTMHSRLQDLIGAGLIERVGPRAIRIKEPKS